MAPWKNILVRNPLNYFSSTMMKTVFTQAARLLSFQVSLLNQFASLLVQSLKGVNTFFLILMSKIASFSIALKKCVKYRLGQV